MSLQNRLATLLGLDDATVSTQIWPLLEQMGSRVQAREYLETLVGNERVAREFVDSYLDAYYPEKKPTATVPRPTAHAPDMKHGGHMASVRKNHETGTTVVVSLSADAVRRLEAVEAKLYRMGEGHSGGGLKQLRQLCFCQGRLHPLSPYTVICTHCALVICELNDPMKPCPSCGKGNGSQNRLVPDDRRAAAIAELRSEQESIIASETERVCLRRKDELDFLKSIRFPTLRQQKHQQDSEEAYSLFDESKVYAALYTEYLNRVAHMKTAPVPVKNVAIKPKKVAKPAPHVLRLDTKGKKHKVQTITKTTTPKSAPKPKVEPKSAEVEPAEIAPPAEAPTPQEVELEIDPECYIDPFDDMVVV